MRGGTTKAPPRAEGADMNGEEKITGEGVRFERIRRITGYLVGTTDRFNNAKRAEERDRVKHCTLSSPGAGAV